MIKLKSLLRENVELLPNGNLRITDINSIRPDQWDRINRIMVQKGYVMRGGEDCKRAVAKFLTNPNNDAPDVINHDIYDAWVETIAMVLHLKKPQAPSKGDYDCRRVLRAAVRYFGLAPDLFMAGYILPNGDLLRMSGGSSGGRDIDHRSIGSVYVKLDIKVPGDTRSSGSPYMEAFMKDCRAIRIGGSQNFLDMWHEPTRQQAQQLLKYFQMYEGEIILVVKSEKYGNVEKQYKNGTSPGKILQDIVAFYRNGEIPEDPTPMREAKKYDVENNVDDAAEYLIRTVWPTMPNDRQDRFNDYQFFLWLDNDQQLSNLFWKLAQKFFPNEEHPEDKFKAVVETKLEELERKHQERMAKKINKLDPLFILKKIVRGKTWEGAKQSLVKNTLGAWGYRGGRITDEEAETAFNRMYKNAMGETVYQEKYFTDRGYGKLSDLRKTELPGRAEDHIRQYSINIFVDYFTGHTADRFPEQVKVYRGTNSPTAKVRPGDYVTFEKGYARTYMRGKFGSIIHDVLPSKDLYVYEVDLDRPELVYWPEGHQIQKYEGNIPTFKEFWKEVNSW